jgi:CIC family chloride channel protein
MQHVKKVTLIPQDMPFAEFKQFFSSTKQHYFPVMDDSERLIGIFSINDVRGVLFASEIEHLVRMKDIGKTDIIFTTPSDDLNEVLRKFTDKNIDGLPVVADDDHTRLLGMLNRREVIAFYNEKVKEIKEKRQTA